MSDSKTGVETSREKETMKKGEDQTKDKSATEGKKESATKDIQIVRQTDPTAACQAFNPFAF
eukprot:1809518-Rhodomonas_salina.4